MHRIRLLAMLAILAVLMPSAVLAKAKPGMSYTDLMQVRKIFTPVLSDDASWIAYEARPDRGDGEVVLRASEGKGEHRIEKGAAPQLSANGSFAAAKIQPSFEERETAEEGDKLHPGAALIRTADGERIDFEKVQGFGFTADSRWFLAHLEAVEPETPEAESEPATEDSSAVEEKAEPRKAGGTLVLHRLSDGAHFEEEFVSSWVVSKDGAYLAFSRATADGADNALIFVDLSGDAPQSRALHAVENGAYSSLTWSEESHFLAFISAVEDELDKFEDIALYDFHPEHTEARLCYQENDVPEGYELARDGKLAFHREATALFFGLRKDLSKDEPDTNEVEFDALDFDAILDKRGVDVWHIDDPRIKTHEKADYEEWSKHEFTQVFNRESGSVTRLADDSLRDVTPPQRGSMALAYDGRAYAKLMTWDGFYNDAWVVDVETGERRLVAKKLQDSVSISPKCGFVVYYDDKAWFLYDTTSGTTRPVGVDVGVSWADEDHDYPRDANDYGVGGWLRDDTAVLIYDKYDIWKIETASGEATCLTAGKGREDLRIYRVAEFQRDEPGIPIDESLLLTGFDERKKNSSLWRVGLDASEFRLLREDDRYYSILAKARDAERFLYTEERYDVFGDLWIAEPDFRKPSRRTDVNPQLEDFDLGRAELVDWTSADGTPLQGILIKPANYDPKKRYPVLVYFYRFFSQRLHRFNDPVVNHRPSFYVYAGDEYAVFLPDIRFEIGRPGFSATKCLVPGVQKLVDMGVADPDGIALHGHSWSGYQGAHVITQTNIFACAVMGAPVTNMTSAYGGIRWKTGLSRQFQYEKTQSRLGADLWSRRDVYIDNSPLFFADRIETPLLMMFGDVDGAVPWTQGIELYMAMRRLNKPCVFLQYRDEPHHLKKYANKLDYSLRMKAFIDHFCKGEPAPEWWTEGEPYQGE